jgi:hypothetical protein
VAVVTLGVPAMLSLGQLAGAPPAGASTLGALHSIACKPLASDPPIEAPLYAQQAGASGVSDGWWCQLPHATAMPVGLSASLRDVAPMPSGYALFSTTFSAATPSSTTTSHGAGSQRSIVVAADVNSAVSPGTTAHGPVPSGGQKVSLAKGVNATVISNGNSVQVTWSYPTHGVPSYLRAVSTVAVTGTNLPKSVVISVAKQVRPD